MAELSPAPQAVMIAATNGNTNVVNDPVYRQCIAAALRAAADQVITENRLAALDTECSAPSRLLLTWARDQLLAIAAELEGTTRDPLEPNDLSHLSNEEFQALAPQGYHGL